jgi:rare lipoprotein A
MILRALIVIVGFNAGLFGWLLFARAQDGNPFSGATSINVVMTRDVGRSFSGVASFYGDESGSKTASGQRFNKNDMTAAHRSLPFGTRLRVTHGSRSVVVTINDRGPFIRGRVLDLSEGAAKAIGISSKGVGLVHCEVL